MSFTASAQHFAVSLERRRYVPTDERAWLLRLAIRADVLARLRAAVAARQMELEERA